MRTARDRAAQTANRLATQVTKTFPRDTEVTTLETGEVEISDVSGDPAPLTGLRTIDNAREYQRYAPPQTDTGGTNFAKLFGFFSNHQAEFPDTQRLPYETLVRDINDRVFRNVFGYEVRADVARLLVDGVFDRVMSLAQEYDVRVPNLGTFHTQDRPAREARNPRTGETVHAEATRVLRFTPSRPVKLLTAGDIDGAEQQ